MTITKEEGKIILESMQHCWDVNGFIDDEDKELFIKIKSEFNLKSYYDYNQNKIIFLT